MKPFRQGQAVHSTRGLTWSGVRHKVNPGERLNGQTNKVRSLQGILTRSLSARMLTVKRVTSSKGARTPGIDGQRWPSTASKMAGALSLWKRGYQAQPLRRVSIAKPGSTKTRPLGIPTMRDRAMQALQLLALDPISETRADTHSYGFRKRPPSATSAKGSTSLANISGNTTTANWSSPRQRRM